MLIEANGEKFLIEKLSFGVVSLQNSEIQKTTVTIEGSLFINSG